MSKLISRSVLSGVLLFALAALPALAQRVIRPAKTSG